MRKRRKLTKEDPRSIIQLAGMKIKAGVDISYGPVRIISFLQKTGGHHGC